MIGVRITETLLYLRGMVLCGDLLPLERKSRGSESLAESAGSGNTPLAIVHFVP